LNICCEPPTFLSEEQQRVFEPLEFFGSLPSIEEPELDSPPGALSHFGDPSRLKVYVSFGTIVWRYYRQEAIAALQAISGFLAARLDVEGLISLGHAALEPAERHLLVGANVRLEEYVDQSAVLREADVFVTHHGINSTHEAIFNRVPMLSYPFFWDQPALAAKCQEMGLAVPLGGSLRGRVSEAAVASAVQELSREAGPRRHKLQRARADELEVIAGRDAVFRRVMGLATGSGSRRH
jgi:UDP:flavonoid glycosyltransferase YjiC (YdhE family)